MNTTHESHSPSGGSGFMARGFSLALFGLSLFSALFALLLDQQIFPYLIGRYPEATSTPFFRETQASVIFVFQHLVFSSIAVALLIRIFPAKRVSWRVPGFVVLVLAGLLRFATPDMALNSIHKPDGVHYQLLAMSMVSKYSWLIESGFFSVPSRMQPAPSLAMALTTWLDADYFGTGIFSIWLASLASIVLVYRIGSRVWGRDTGLLAALLLSLSAIHVHFSRSLMGEIPWVLANIAALGLIVCGSFRIWRFILAGVIIGFGMMFKQNQMMLAGAFGLVMIAFRFSNPAEIQWRSIVGFCLGVVAGFAPLLVYQKLVLGGWLFSGYHAWDLDSIAMENILSWSFLFGLDARGRGIGTVPAYLFSFSGLDPRPDKTIWYFPLSLLVWLPLLRLRTLNQGTPRQRFAFYACLVSTILFCAPFLFFGHRQPRYFLPVLPCWMLLMSLSIVGLARWPRLQEFLSSSLWVVIAILVAALSAEARIQINPVREPERVAMTRAAQAMESYDCLVTDEDRMLMAHFGAWREYDQLIPLVATGEPFLLEHPMEKLRSARTVSYAFEGVSPAIQKRLDQNKRVALWLRYPHRNKAVVRSIFHDFSVMPVAKQDLSGWYEIHPRQQNSSGAPAPILPE